MSLRSRNVLQRALLLVALLASLSSTGCSQWLPGALRSGVIEPSIVPSPTQSGTLVVDSDFEFETARVELKVPIDRAVYAGSESAPKTAIFFGRSQPPDWVPDYYRAFVEEKHQQAFYQSLAEALHAVRREKRLDSARYVELVTSMAQEMEYRTDPGNLAPKFPIETFGDGYGDCDDKTLLAASVLSRDGYDVAILLFSPEKHVALGIRAPGLDYKKTGYAYVEMTVPSLVGIAPDELRGGVRLTSQPEVIRIGQATQAYSAGKQILYIERRLAEVRTVEKRLRTQIEDYNAELTTKQRSLEEQRRALQGHTDPASLALAVRRYNEQVRAYNDLAAQVNELVSRYNALVDAERYVANHQTARPQVYARLRTLRL